MAYENGVSFRAVIMAKPQGERERQGVACGAGKKERLNLTPKQVIVNALPSFAEGDERRASDDLHADEARRHTTPSKPLARAYDTM